MSNFSNKTVFITGASRGIGKAIARGMLQSGAMEAVHFNRSNSGVTELLKEFKDQVKPVQGDLNSVQGCIAIFETAVKQLNGLDVLVNNAGIALHSPLDLEDQDWSSDWHKTLQINLISASLLCKKAIDLFIKQQGGRIINITSRAAFRGDTSDYWAYAASKGGLVSLTRSIARGFGKQNIMAFNLAPGFVRTDMAQEFVEQYGEEMILNDIALKQLTTPVDLVPMTILLASGLADHATGTTIDFNAGSYVH